MEKFIAAVITFFTAFLFIIGYVYLSYYYKFFGISMQEVNFSIPEIASHSLVIILKSVCLPSIYIPATALTITLFAVKFKWHTKILLRLGLIKYLEVVSQIAILLIAIAAFVICFFIFQKLMDQAKSMAENQAKDDLYIALPLWVSIDPKKEGVFEPLKDSKARLYFLTSTEKLIFAVVRYNDGSDFLMLKIPKSESTSMRIQFDG